MTVVFVIFLLYVTSNTYANSIPNVDYNAAAADLLNKVTTLKDNANKIKSQVDNVQSHLKEKADTLDYGIPQNPDIIKIASIIQQHQAQRGIEVCVKIRDDNVQALKYELESIFTNQMTNQLNNNKLTLDAILQTLESISENVQGSNLDEEISLCTDNPNKCRLTIEYPGEIDHSDKAINFLATTNDSLVDAILKTAVSPVLIDKVVVEICTPVLNCIHGL